MLTRVRLLQIGEVKVRVANLRIPRPVVPGRRLVVELELPEAVVGELVHEAVEERGGALRVHAELAALSEVVGLADVVGVLALGDADHPEKLVDVVAGVAWGE